MRTLPAILVALSATCLAMAYGKFQYNRGFAEGELEGRVTALADVSIDGTMVYISCLAEPPGCEKQRAVSDWAQAWAQQQRADLGLPN